MNWLKANKFYLLIGLSLLAVLYIGSCERDSNNFQISDKLGNTKAEIKQKKQEAKEVKKDVLKADTIQKKAVRKWNKVKEVALKDTIAKCDTIIKILVVTCDSALAAKDSLISELRSLVILDSAIILKQDTLIHAHEKTNSDLTKSVKKEKRKSWWKGFKTGFAAGFITGGVAGSKIK